MLTPVYTVAVPGRGTRQCRPGDPPGCVRGRPRRGTPATHHITHEY